LVVLLLPVATGLGAPRLEPAHVIFLSATLAVSWLNYVPTRAGIAASLAGCQCALYLALLAGLSVPLEWIAFGQMVLAMAPWAAWWALRGAGASRGFDQVWLSFRDRYGFLWAQRVREQFNRSAASGGLAGRLGWSGLEPPDAESAEALQILRALLKRFGPADLEASRASDVGQDGAN
jgi:hypothetical protein